jgi:DNA-binding NarL/FixJ family response regulator
MSALARYRIAVWDPLPVFRLGLISALAGADHRVEEPGDLVAWAAEGDRRAVLMTVGGPDDLESLRRLGKLEPRPLIVALLDDMGVEVSVRMLTAGAVSVAPRSGDPGAIRQALDAAMAGRSILPAAVTAALVERYGLLEESDGLSERDLSWLKALSQGATVAHLARTMGYSERAMYRLLRDLYRRMNVTTRSEAVLRATRSGLV